MSTRITAVLVSIVVLFAIGLGGVMLFANSEGDDNGVTSQTSAMSRSTSPTVRSLDSASTTARSTENRRNRVTPTRAAEANAGYNPEVLLPRNDPNYGAQTQEHIDHAEKFAVDKYPNQSVSSFDVLAPGSTITYKASADGGDYTCTSGYIVQGGDKNYALTAGHCKANAQRDAMVQFAGKNKELADAGTFAQGQTLTKSVSAGLDFETDVAEVELKPDTPGDRSIARKKYFIDGVAQPGDIKAGTEICKWGAKTLETCGKVIAANDSLVRVNVFSSRGDSGSPAYIRTGKKDDKGREHVLAVGILSGSPENVSTGETFDYISDFSLLAPIVKAWGLNVTPYLG